MIGHLLVFWILFFDPAAQVRCHAFFHIPAEDLFDGFSLPQALRERRAIVWWVRLCRYDPNTPFLVDLPDAADGSRCCHPSTDNQIPITQHVLLLMFSSIYFR